MYCPESVVLSRYCFGVLFSIIRHEKTDYYNGTPWREKLNPLRYAFGALLPSGRMIRINRGGKWERRRADLFWHARCLFTRDIA
jgi:hypothetical protein